MLVKLFIILALVVLALQAWFRLAPSDVAAWHVPPEAQPGKGTNWVVEIWPGDGETLKALDALIRATARTQRLAGSPEDGLVTYVTRSLFWGFPDYTTLSLGENGLILRARSRYGRSDFGVNAARLAAWKQQLEARDRVAR